MCLLSLFKSVSCKWKGKHTGFSKFKRLKSQTVRQLAAFITREISGALSKAIAVLKEIIAQTGAKGPQEMGKVMGVATKQLAGKAEGKTISAIVKQLLNN